MQPYYRHHLSVRGHCTVKSSFHPFNQSNLIIRSLFIITTELQTAIWQHIPTVDKSTESSKHYTYRKSRNEACGLMLTPEEV